MSKIGFIVSLLICHALAASFSYDFLFPDQLYPVLYDNTHSTSYQRDILAHEFFEWKLLEAELASTNDNVVISPYTIKLLLLVLFHGSAENSQTYKELSKALPGLERQYDQFVYINKTLGSLLEQSEYFELNIASQIFVDNSISLKKNFEKLAKDLFKSPSTKLDFNNINKALETINNWVSRQTNGHIEKLVEKDDLEDAVAILLNAIYFKGTWKLPFDENLTENKSFYVNPSKTINVPTMSNVGNYFLGYLEELKSDILRLPYLGDKYSLYVILPNDKDGLDNLLKTITPKKVQQLQTYLEEIEVAVQLPKFKFDYKTELKETLKKLGINDIFEDSANFDNLSSTPVKVSNIVQKAGIIVDEKGTTAFAATDAGLDSRVFGQKEFIANHPFLFIVQDEITGSLLFAGKVNVPKF